MPRSFGYMVLQILIDWIDRIAVESPLASGLLLGLQNKTSYRAFGVAKEPQNIRPWKISDHLPIHCDKKFLRQKCLSYFILNSPSNKKFSPGKTLLIENVSEQNRKKLR